MRALRVQVREFRNYRRADVAPCPGITVFHGQNAQGKTALLEAVFLCCTGRSHRTPRDKELIRWNQPAAHITLDIARADGSRQIDIQLSSFTKKQVRINGSPISRSGELMGHANAVLFSPEDLRMIKDGPAERRRFIDMELSQIRPAYYYALQRYHRALAQRSAVLKNAALNPPILQTLDDWDLQLALSGADIIDHRRRFVALLHENASLIHSRITAGSEQLQISYDQSLNTDATGSALADAFLHALQSARHSDLRRQSTAVGPHRDDLAILINGADARAFGSQGQQRTCALSLKLSELRVMRDLTGEWPILMLDDVMSELDPARRRHLFAHLEGVQTLVTCTDPADLAGAEVGLMLRVDNGTATP